MHGYLRRNAHCVLNNELFVGQQIGLGNLARSHGIVLSHAQNEEKREEEDGDLHENQMGFSCTLSASFVNNSSQVFEQ